MTTKTNMQKKQIRELIALLLIGAFISLPAVGAAQDGANNHRIVHQRIKHHFDNDGNGTLTGREAIKARQFHNRWHNNHDRPGVRPHRRHPDAGSVTTE